MIWQGVTKRKNLPSAAGFSLVEIMMVILLIGLLAGVSGPAMFSYLRSNQMQTRVDTMVADLQYSRAMAVSTGEIHRFDATITGYTVTNVVTGVTLRTENFDEGAKLDKAETADFFPWGMASTKTLNLTHHNMKREIQILPTGMVEVTNVP